VPNIICRHKFVRGIGDENIEGTPADPDRLAVGQKPAAMRQNPETAELDDRGVSDI
jgi:hypothetical protein